MYLCIKKTLKYALKIFKRYVKIWFFGKKNTLSKNWIILVWWILKTEHWFLFKTK